MPEDIKNLHGIERMNERTSIRKVRSLRKNCIKHLIQAYRSLKTDRIAIKFNINTSNGPETLVVVFSNNGFLVTVLTEEMFTLKTRVRHQYALHNLTKQEVIMIKHGISIDDPELMRLWLNRNNTKSINDKPADNIVFTIKKSSSNP